MVNLTDILEQYVEASLKEATNEISLNLENNIKAELYEMIVKLQKENAGEGTDITDLKGTVEDIEDAIGDETTSGTILYRIKALEDA